MTPIRTTLFALLCFPVSIAAQGHEPAEKPAAQEPAKKEDKKKQEPKKGEKQDKKADAKKDGAKDASEKVDFAAQVWPILEKNCIECHKTASTGSDGKKKRPKGGVTLDSKDGIEKSKKGKLVVGKKPDDSLLVHSITLPADDEDRMPPAKKGDPLAQTDIDLIKKWIDEGADFGSWTGGETKSDGKGEDKPADEKGDGKPEAGDKPDGEKNGKGEKAKKNDKG